MPRTKKIAQSTKTEPVNNTKVIELDSIHEDSQLYQKLSHLEHVLKRPATYIGSIEKSNEEMYILDKTDPENIRVVKKTIEIIPGLYKIFDEILVNAMDQYTRLITKKEAGDMSIFTVSNIKIDIDKDTGRITVFNDGEGIHIVQTSEDGVYAPELIFGHLLTGTNYNDEEEKTVGGQNGYGSKLTNIFSKEFTIETVDKTRNLKYVQTFTNNMSEKTVPKITTYSSKPYTKVSFIPDYARFGIDGLTDDMYNLMEKRIYDVAAWTDKSVNVSLNGEKLDYKCFEKYVDLYIGDKTVHPRIHLKLNDRWETIITYNTNSNFDQVSFVNGINTIRGGKHVEYILGQVRDGLVEYIRKKKKVQVKPATVRNELFIFLKTTIVNPSFDSQTKETLMTPVSKFGSNATIDDKMIDRIAKIGIMDNIMNSLESKNNKELQKTDGKKQNVIRGLPKLRDAEFAGTKDSKLCTLILTEGDSAKASVISGIDQQMGQYYGVFPLRGKLLNVKDMDAEKIIKNEEISAIKKILGLKSGEEYSNEGEWDLRYGKLMVLCDSDVDGSHIKGLLINFFHSFWPSLLQTGFVITMLTPIVKVFKGSQKHSFYNLGDYNTWKSATPDYHSWENKYYKGLGTSSSSEFKEYFKDLKILNYTWSGDNSDKAIDLAFNKKRADDRKKWLEGYDIANTLDYAIKDVPFENFIDKELIHFSNYDNIRSIPNILDGLKPSQRKILFSAFKRNLTKEIKVAQFSGYVSEQSAYHHGEVSLQSTIVNMAQNYVGSNNVSLFVPSGQFGTRLQNGKDHASARYIFTYLHPITKFIYREEDLPIMSYQDDDGMPIEPTYYMPIIPMILVNGARGIGSGYSTYIPPHNPKDILGILRNLLEGKPLSSTKPWFNGFKGSVDLVVDEQYINRGRYEILDDTTIHISELPIGTSIEEYKNFLENVLIDKANTNKKQFVKSYRENGTDKIVSFTVKLAKEKMDDIRHNPKSIEDLFGLSDTSNTNYNNMHLYNSDIKLHKYQSIFEIIMEFYGTRLDYYSKRKEYLLGIYKNELDLLKEKYRFIQSIIDGSLEMRGKKRAEVETLLEQMGFLKLANTVGKETSYDYLVQMPIYSLTQEKLDELKEKMEKKQKEYDDLLAKDIKHIWLTELNELDVQLDKYYSDFRAEFENGEIIKPKKAASRVTKKK
jgi:DNA topoisomerase-2